MKQNFTENEQRILNHLPKQIKWIARDEENNLKFFEKKPSRQKRAGIVFWTSEEPVYSANMFKHLFSNITYLNLEPTEITKTKEEADEKFLLSQFNPIYKWIARDEDGTLTLFDKKPILIKPKKGKFKGQISWENFSKWHTINLFGHLFTEIKTTNPTRIEDYVK